MRKILLVPERIVSWGAGATLFDRADLRIRGARTAAQALQVAEVWKPDLVITSNSLDGFDLSDFVQAIRSTAPQARILVLTEVIEAEADNLDVDANLIEPVEEKIFLDTIGVLLELGLRRDSRIAVDIAAQLFSLEGDRQQLANILNISVAGCLVELAEPLEIGTVQRMQFWLPEIDQLITAEFEVRGMVDEFQLHYGVEFVDIEPTHRKLVEDYLSRCQS